MKRLLIIGAGGHGVVVAEAAAGSGLWNEIQFLDDDIAADSVPSFPIVGRVYEFNALADDDTGIIVAIGDNRVRLALSSDIASSGCHLATVVHPTACISSSASISPGAVVCAGAIINARAMLGRASILSTGATVDHDCDIAAGAHISPGANLAGNVTVGECAWIGIGSAVREGVHIGRDVIAGAGSAIISDVGDGETVGGVPAKRLVKQ